MEKVQVTISIPKAEKDLIDMAVKILKDVKAEKGNQILADILPDVVKIIGEISELIAELKSKESFVALAYLTEQLINA